MGVEESPCPNRARKALWVLAACVALLVYAGSYVVWSRLCPGRDDRLDGTHYYTFVAASPDWEHALYAAYYPLIWIDERISNRRHSFDVDFM